MLIKLPDVKNNLKHRHVPNSKHREDAGALRVIDDKYK